MAPPRRACGRRTMKHAVKHIHFVGIGGSGRAGIAEVCSTRLQGERIGSANNSATRRLVELGARVVHDTTATTSPAADAVVVSADVRGR